MKGALAVTLYRGLSEWSEWFWPLFADHLWQTTLFALIAWVAVLLLHRATARSRHLIWMIAFAKFLLPSACLIFAMESIGLDLSQVLPQGASIDGSGFEVLLHAESGLSASRAGSWALGDLFSGLTLAWILGAIVSLTRWVMHRRRFARAVQDGIVITSGCEADALSQAKSRLSLEGQIGIVESPGICAPGVWGVRRPVVVLPEGLAGKLSINELEAVMIHELIHISRHDNLSGTLQMLLCCLFWFHPLIWLIDRKLLTERELVCDEDVINYTGQRHTYAAGLWKVAQFGLGWDFARIPRATGSNLRRRIELIMKMQRRTKLSLAGRAMTSLSVGVLLIFAFTMAVFTRDEVEKVDTVQLETQPDTPLIPASKGERVWAKGTQTREDVRRIASTPRSRLVQSRIEVEQSKGADGSGDGIEPMSVDLRPTILYKEKAKYTAEAIQNNTEGVVVLTVVFAVNGYITNISVVRGLPDRLTEQAIEAAQKIRFEPAVKDGRRVSVRGNLEFNFSLKPSVDKSTTDQGRDQEKVEQTRSGVKQEETMASEDIYSMDASLRPRITYKEKATYTPEARANEVQGTVVLNAIFSTEGRVTNIQVMRGLPHGLTQQAIAAAQKIRFEPAMKDGMPVSVRGNLEYTFNLD
jgi:TonB family protein